MRSIGRYVKSATEWFKYYRAAVTKYQVQSPFLSNFVEHVLVGKGKPKNFLEIEQCRSQLFTDHRKITIQDFGAPSRGSLSDQRSIANIARISLAPPQQARLLFRLVQYLRPETMLELGTSFGISTLYQHEGNPSADFYSIEGHSEIHARARQIIDRLSNGNIHLIHGPFSDRLQPCLDRLGNLDYVFIDGDHLGIRLQAYTNTLMPHLHAGSTVVLHDIHWSADMANAWSVIRCQQNVTASIDLFTMGILFFREEILEPIHLNLIPYRFKPWLNGFFS